MSNSDVHDDQKIDQPMIAASLAFKGLSPSAIHKDFMSVLGHDAMAYSSVTSLIREACSLPSDQDTSSVEDQKGIDEADQAIMFALDENTFASVWQLSRLTRRPSTTVYQCLTQSLGFAARHLRWLPQVLSHAQKANRVDMSRRLLRMLEVQHGRFWHAIVTLNELWFYVRMDHEFTWLPQGEKVHERERYIIQSPKFMMRIVGIDRGCN
jgi:hypothetical protein